jgi:hypothetical protein
MGRGSALVWLVLALVTPSAVLAQEQFLCLGDKATGFRWDGRSWVTTDFTVGQDKFLVQEVAPKEYGFKVYNYVVKKFGSDEITHHCDRSKMGDGKMGARILCGGLGYGMLIDVVSMRYQEVYGLGYIDGKDAPGNTPSFTIGTCTRLK